MKLNDVILEAASPAQQAAIAISMKKAGKKPKQGVAEGSGPQVGDAVYYGKRLVGWFKGYSEHGKIITEPNYEEMGDEYANRDVYWDPQDKITIRPEQGVAEGSGPEKKMTVGQALEIAKKNNSSFTEKDYYDLIIRNEGLDSSFFNSEVMSAIQKKQGESVSLRDMVDVVDRHYPKYYAELSGSDISNRQFERAIVNAYKKIMQKQGVAEGSDTYKQGHAKFHTKTNKQVGPTHYGRSSDKKADSYTKADPRYHEVRPVKEQGVAEDAVSDFIARGGQIQQGKLHKPRKGETWQGSSHIGAAGGRGTKGTVSGKAANTNPKGGKPVVSAEGYNPEYNDEAGMADNNLETLQRAVEGIDDLIQSGDNLPEWCQEKIAVAKSMLVAVWDYMYSEEASDEVDPEVDEMFEAMQELVAEMAVKNRVSEDLVWEQFEAMPDNVLYETAAWRRKEGKSKKGGLNAKGVASYRRENPGSKLQMAVTTKPSKLKKGSKAAKRRKSFCARMSGVKGPMKKPNGKPTRKALALRKWNC